MEVFGHRWSGPLRAGGAGLALSMIVCLAVAPGSARAQDVPSGTPTVGGPRRDSTAVPVRHSPGGAFLRSVLIPGWGQATVGSPTRGGFYFGLESLNFWMIMKTRRSLGSARNIAEFRRAEAEARIVAGGETDPVAIESLIDEDEAVQSADELVEIRAQQREDWMATGIFFLLLGGADAFVAAHLADFPEPLRTSLRPLPDMGAELAFSLPFDPFRPRAHAASGN